MKSTRESDSLGGHVTPSTYREGSSNLSCNSNVLPTAPRKCRGPTGIQRSLATGSQVLEWNLSQSSALSSLGPITQRRTSSEPSTDMVRPPCVTDSQGTVRFFVDASKPGRTSMTSTTSPFTVGV